MMEPYVSVDPDMSGPKAESLSLPYLPVGWRKKVHSTTAKRTNTGDASSAISFKCEHDEQPPKAAWIASI
jgi:hypothetical protein